MVSLHFSCVCIEMVELFAKVFLLAILAASRAHAWLNEYDQPVNFECPEGQFISHVNSIHDNRHEDRLWDYGCSAIPVEATVTNCQWTNYQNEYDAPLTFMCQNDGYIAGIASVHDNKHEDRKFKFQCCEISGGVTHLCSFTGYENDWDGLLEYYVPPGKILTGMSSYHDNHREDRRWKFDICSVDLA